MHKPPKGLVIAAFAAVYTLWGSTYLAIRYAIETLPPFLMAGVRFLLGGVILYAWGRSHGGKILGGGWRAAVISGALLLFFGNGSVVVAEQWVPSGTAALLVATLPVWMSLIEWMLPGGKRPGFQVVTGIVIGFVGVALLVGIDNLGNGGAVYLPGALLLVFASIAWAMGSLYSRQADISTSSLMTSGMQMTAAGILFLAVSTVAGEWVGFPVSPVSMKSVLAVLYLIVFGSIVGFTCYSWLLKVAPPAQVATYAYVNPAVAVFLGWMLAGEPLTSRMLGAMAVIITAVVVITTSGITKPASTRGKLTSQAELKAP